MKAFKKFIFCLSLFHLCFISTKAQTLTFNDTIFKVGQYLPKGKVYFEFDKSEIKAESFPYLDSIADFLLKYQTLKIEVENHTDSRWSDKYSRCLTCSRAKAVVSYLISKGVKPERLIAKGYNNMELLIPESEINKMKTKDEIEKAHQANRRTQFKILYI